MARRPKGLPVGPVSTPHYHAITIELVRLCLGGRGPERPELIPTRVEVLNFLRQDQKKRRRK